MTPEQYSYSLPSISQPPTLPQLDKYLKEDPQLSRWRARMHLALVYKGMESQMKRGRRNQVRTGIEREKYCSSPSIVTWILTIKHISTSLSKEEIEFHFLISHWVVISMLHLLTQSCNKAEKKVQRVPINTNLILFHNLFIFFHIPWTKYYPIIEFYYEEQSQVYRL